MKPRVVAILLAVFLGGLGIHCFYMNRPGRGILYLLFCWTFIPALVALCEAVGLLLMSDASFEAQYRGGSGPTTTAGPRGWADEAPEASRGWSAAKWIAVTAIGGLTVMVAAGWLVATTLSEDAISTGTTAERPKGVTQRKAMTTTEGRPVLARWKIEAAGVGSWYTLALGDGGRPYLGHTIEGVDGSSTSRWTTECRAHPGEHWSQDWSDGSGRWRIERRAPFKLRGARLFVANGDEGPHRQYVAIWQDGKVRYYVADGKEFVSEPWQGVQAAVVHPQLLTTGLTAEDC